MPKVTFQKSNVTCDWDPAEDSLLELGESQGVDLDFGCRVGNCTACQQPLLSGDVDYPNGHGGEPDTGHVLLCCSVPRKDVVIDA